MTRTIQERNVALIYVYSFLTFGIYGLYWLVSTKRDINSLGGEIPTTWIVLVPFAGFYHMYKYCEGYATKVKKDDNTIMYFCLAFFVGFVMPAIVQPELNKKARASQAPSLVKAAA